MYFMLHPRRKDSVWSRYCLNSVARFYTKLIGGTDRLHLEEFLDAGEEGLDAAKTPVRKRLFLQSLEVCLLLNLNRDVRGS